MHVNLSFKTAARAVPLLRALRLLASERRRKQEEMKKRWAGVKWIKQWM